MKLPLFGLGMQGKSAVVTAKKLQNFFAEFRPQGEKTQVVAHGFPGLDLFADFGDTAHRGAPLALEQNGLLYTVHRSTFWEINNVGNKTSRGTLNTVSGYVEMASDGTVILLVDGTNGYTYNTGTATFAQITDPDFPANPVSATRTAGVFVVGFASGRFYTSANGTSWDALDFANAESKPDRIQKVMEYLGELVVFGDLSTEFWGAGGSDFDFTKIQGADLDLGLAARASAAKVDNGIAFLAKSPDGEVFAVKLMGHQIEKISTPDLDTIINSFSVVTDATGHAYMHGGHAFYQLNFPAAGQSFCYDALTGIWSARKSFNQSRHRAEFAAQYLAKTILTDASNGRLYKLNRDTYSENGDPIEGEIIGEHWDSELERASIDCIRLDMEVGSGIASGQGSDPQMMLSVSKDGGKTFGTERWRSAGKIGDYRRRVEWRRFGHSRRWTVKIRITDPVRRVVTGAYINPE